MNERYVLFQHDIYEPQVRALQTTLLMLVSQGVEKITLVMSTNGGDVNHGIMLYNFLKALPVDLTTHNIGNVDSIGNTIFLSGSKRYANRNATFMFHGVGRDVKAGVRFEIKNTKEMLGSFEASTRRISITIAACTNLPLADVEKLFVEQVTKDAEYAKQVGIIHEIVDLTIPKGMTVVQSPAS